MALPHPDVNAVLRFPAKLGTSHKKAPQNLFKTPFAPSNFLPRRHTAAPHVFLRRAGRLCPPLHTSAAPALCPYPVIPSQCSHWRGNPNPRARRRGTPSRWIVQRDIPRLRARGTFAHGGKSTQKRRSNLRFENPCAPSHSTHFDHISHANAVPCKFPLNVALSLLLFPLPLSL